MAAEIMVRLDLTIEDAEHVRLMLRWLQQSALRLSEQERVILNWLVEQLTLALLKAHEQTGA